MRPLLLLLLAPAFAHAEVAPDAVVAEAELAVANADPKTPIGDAVAAGALEPSEDLAADLVAIREGMIGRGHRILRSDDGSLTVEIKRARVTIALGQRGGSISVTPNPSATVAPGRCVAIPQVGHPVVVRSHAIRDDGESHEGTTHWLLTTTYAIDVDGDGIPDAFVPQPRSKDACPEEVSWRVYVTRGACGHDVGVVGPSFPQINSRPLDASGFRPLVAESVTTRLGARAIPDHITTTNRFAVRHGAYARVETKQQVDACHHCATWRCSAY